MLSSPRARFAYVIAMLAAFAGVLGLAAITLKQAIHAGAAEAWMMAGVLAVASWLQQRMRKSAIVPKAGENVPGMGR